MAEQRKAEAYWELVEPVWDEIHIYDGPEVFLRNFSAVPEHAGLLFAVHFSTSEIENGGLDQFFYNDTGILAPEAVKGFQAIGMPNTAAVLEEAMARLSSDYPRARDDRMDALDRFTSGNRARDNDDGTDPFEDLDNRFYDLTEHENGGVWAAADRYASQFPLIDTAWERWRRKMWDRLFKALRRLNGPLAWKLNKIGFERRRRRLMRR